MGISLADTVASHFGVPSPGAVNDKLRAFFGAMYTGMGSPEGVVTAPTGSFYFDLQNADIYDKKSGSGNTGWIVEGSGGGGGGGSSTLTTGTFDIDATAAPYSVVADTEELQAAGTVASGATALVLGQALNLTKHPAAAVRSVSLSMPDLESCTASVATAAGVATVTVPNLALDATVHNGWFAVVTDHVNTGGNIPNQLSLLPITVVDATNFTVTDGSSVGTALSASNGSVVVRLICPPYFASGTVVDSTHITLSSATTIQYKNVNVLVSTDDSSGLAAAVQAAADLSVLLGGQQVNVMLPDGTVSAHTTGSGTNICAPTQTAGTTAVVGLVGKGRYRTRVVLCAPGRFTADWFLCFSPNVSATTSFSWKLIDFTVAYYGPGGDNIKLCQAPGLVSTNSGPTETDVVHVYGEEAHPLGHWTVMATASGISRKRFRIKHCRMYHKYEGIKGFSNINSFTRSLTPSTTTHVITDAAATTDMLLAAVSGTGIPTGTWITAVTAGTSFEINNLPTAGGSAVTLTIEKTVDVKLELHDFFQKQLSIAKSAQTDADLFHHSAYVHPHTMFDAVHWNTESTEGTQWILHGNGGGAVQPLQAWKIDHWNHSGPCAYVAKTGAAVFGGLCKISNMTVNTDLSGGGAGSVFDPVHFGTTHINGLYGYAQGGSWLPAGTGSCRVEHFRTIGGPFCSSGFTGRRVAVDGTHVANKSNSHAMFFPGAGGIAEMIRVVCDGDSDAGSNPQFACRCESAGSILKVIDCDFGGTWLTTVINVAGTAGSRPALCFVDQTRFSHTNSVPSIRDATSTGTDGPIVATDTNVYPTTGYPKATGATLAKGNRVKVGRGSNPVAITPASTTISGLGFSYDTHHISGAQANISTMFIGANAGETVMCAGVPITLIPELTPTAATWTLASGTGSCQFAETLTVVAGRAVTFVLDAVDLLWHRTS